ncbi:hypothetical protein FRC11_011757, partial [Ceratobasidium sp. 423]
MVGVDNNTCTTDNGVTGPPHNSPTVHVAHPFKAVAYNADGEKVPLPKLTDLLRDIQSFADERNKAYHEALALPRGYVLYLSSVHIIATRDPSYALDYFRRVNRASAGRVTRRTRPIP